MNAMYHGLVAALVVSSALYYAYACSGSRESCPCEECADCYEIEVVSNDG